MIFGLAQALGSSTEYESGLPVARRFRDIDLPVLADIPKSRSNLSVATKNPAVSADSRRCCARHIERAVFGGGHQIEGITLLSRGL